MIIYIDKAHIKHKKVLLRVDFNVSMKGSKITDDARIRATLPTIQKLLKDNNRLIIVSHLGRPDGWDEKFLLRPIALRLHKYLPNIKLIVVDDFTTEGAAKIFEEQKVGEIIFLENIRFFKEEEDPSTSSGQEFVKNLASLADVYVNDAFGVSHRDCASITEVPKFLPHYGGLLMEREVETIGHAMRHPTHPFAAIIGGAKVSTKLKLLFKLTEKADYLILGGGLANTLLYALGYPVGKSLCEKDCVDEVKKIVRHAKEHKTKILLPRDVVVGDKNDTGKAGVVKKISDIDHNDDILDIGPESQADYAKAILSSKTLIWNGPVGYMENPEYARGTDFLYYTIAQNKSLISIVGGGDTLAAISKKEYLSTITHISTGGGAMLEYIENGTLPGIEALKK
ncbi:MAG: phosphoglycerate kinase [Candidatus Levybacteria bacterium]|nr:phosphoglycerate kinase [Candidatus Levybacteria bacterium]